MSRSSARWARAPLAVLATATALLLSACGGAASPSSSEETGDDLTVQLSWFTNAQNGGWSTAVTEGFLAEEGFGDVTLLPGGPNVSGLQLLASGRADIAVTTAENYLQARQEGLPITAVYNEFDTPPTGVLVKQETGWTDWQDLAGRAWTVAPSSLGWQWVQRSQGIDFPTQNFNGSYAAFFAAPDSVTQGYPTNTVYQARQEGFELNYFSYASAGFDPFGQVLVVNNDYLAENGDALTRALAALSRGWTAYLTDVEAAGRANEQMLTENDQLAPDVNWFTWDGQRQFVIGDRGGEQMGVMDQERWDTTISQMIEMGALNADFAPDGPLFDNSFLPDEVLPQLDALPAAPAGSYEGAAPAADLVPAVG